MLSVLALLAVTAVEPTVSTAWLQTHLTDPQVRVICTGTRDDYDRAHIPGEVFCAEDQRLKAGHPFSCTQRRNVAQIDDTVRRFDDRQQRDTVF